MMLTRRSAIISALSFAAFHHSKAEPIPSDIFLPEVITIHFGKSSAKVTATEILEALNPPPITLARLSVQD